MREALWLCIDRLCHTPVWRDAETDIPDFHAYYTMDSSCKRRFQEAAEYLNKEQYIGELEDSYRDVMSRQPLWGKMLEDWFLADTSRRCVTECSGTARPTTASISAWMDGLVAVPPTHRSCFRLLHDGVVRRAETACATGAHASAKRVPLRTPKRFIQQHYQEALRLEDVSNAVGFNATYFSAMFKKETGQNFMDYLTELRMNKAKELLCSDESSVQDVADQIGYRDLKYFSRLFKKTTGISPSEYKKLYR